MLGLFPVSTISLSLEGWTLRLLETQGRQVLAWANIPVSPNLVRNGVVSDPPGLGKAIGEAFKVFKGGGLARRNVVCALNAPQSVSRLLTVPKAKGVNLDKVVEREVRRLFPAAPEDSFIRWQAIAGKGMTQQQVYVLTIPKEPLLAMASALRAAGIRPQSMELRTLALARSVNRKDAILANLESNSLDVVIVMDDIPVLIRSMYLGDEPLPIATAQDRLLGELTRTLSYYNDTNRANPLPNALPVFLTGDLAADPDLVAPVEDSTGHPVWPLEPPLDCPLDFPSSQYMVNIGLALKEL